MDSIDRRLSPAARRRLLQAPIAQMMNMIGRMSAYDIGWNRRLLLSILAARLDVANEAVAIANAYVAAGDGLLHGTVWADINAPVCAALRDFREVEIDRGVGGLRLTMKSSDWSVLDATLEARTAYRLITFGRMLDKVFGKRSVLRSGALPSPPVDSAYPLLSRPYPVAFAAMLRTATDVYGVGPVQSVGMFGGNNISLRRNGMADEAGNPDWTSIDAIRFETRHGLLVFDLGFGRGIYGIVVHDPITSENIFHGPAGGIEPIGEQFWRLAETALRLRTPPIVPGTTTGVMAGLEPLLNTWCFGPDFVAPEAAPEPEEIVGMTFEAG